MYDAKETAAYAATMDIEDEEQAVLDAACGAAQVHANLCAELREEASTFASASASSSVAGRSAKAVARAADEGTTPRIFIIGIPVAAQEQDGHSKPKKLKTN
jgi:hypothetical protein